MDGRLYIVYSIYYLHWQQCQNVRRNPTLIAAKRKRFDRFGSDGESRIFWFFCVRIYKPFFVVSRLDRIKEQQQYDMCCLPVHYSLHAPVAGQ